MLHAFDDRQGHIYALCLGLFVQPLGIAPKRLSPSGIDIKRRVTGEIVLQRVGQRIKRIRAFTEEHPRHRFEDRFAD